jgi:hypothetical protein
MPGYIRSRAPRPRDRWPTAWLGNRFFNHLETRSTAGLVVRDAVGLAPRASLRRLWPFVANVAGVRGNQHSAHLQRLPATAATRRPAPNESGRIQPCRRLCRPGRAAVVTCSQVLPAAGYTRRDPRSGTAMTVGITVNFQIISNLALDRGRHNRACGRGGIGSGTTRAPTLSPVVANVATPPGRDAVRAIAPSYGQDWCMTLGPEC